MTSRTRLLMIAVIVLAIVIPLAIYFVLTRATAGPAAPPAPPPRTAGSWYELHFTRPTYPFKPENARGGPDEKLVSLVDSAKVSIDAADYDFDLENVANALAKAKARGVRVRFVTDTDTLRNEDAAIQRAWTILKRAEIPVVDDQRGPIMHHKFMVVDGATVWTGSLNWTVGDTYRLDNNAIKIESPELAANYTAEFERMFVQRQFGPGKTGGSPRQQITIGGTQVESMFAPKDRIAERIAERVAAATQSVQFLAFSFTDDRIGTAMRARQTAGVPVRGVFETTGASTRFSELTPMRQAGLEVYTDGNPYVMHHKVIVLDGRTTIFGSYNFSSNAATDNDENILMVDDPGLAQAFLGEVERVVAQARAKPQ